MQKFIFAHGVHSGGGLTLLKLILSSVEGSDKYSLILDARCYEVASKYCLPNVKFFNPGLIGRLQAEFFLKKEVSSESRVLSFNSLPFLIKINCSTYLFFQNVNLISPASKKNTIGFLKFNIFRMRSKNIDQFIVQTKSVSELVANATGRASTICTLLDHEGINCLKKAQDSIGNEFISRKKFVYVADGAKHKNHDTLLQAWKLCKQTFKGFNGELFLTLDRKSWAKIQRDYDVEPLSITNLGILERNEVLDLLKESDALMFPSLKESFGLPLIEAEACGLDIIASDLDFVRDVVSPVEVFDPNSHVSIARALSRYLGLLWPSRIRLVTADELLEEVFNA